jgi:phospholipid-binding lipoprotein MlaA
VTSLEYREQDDFEKDAKLSAAILPAIVFLAGVPAGVESVSQAVPTQQVSPVVTPVKAADAPSATPATETLPSVPTPVVPTPVVPTPVMTAPASTADQGPPDETTIVVTARSHVPSDPLQDVNAVSFSVVQSVDKALVGPISLAYRDTIPAPVRSGLRNFLDNLQEPVVFLNFMLQLKPVSAAKTLSRFTINSTIGVGGLIDVAKRKPFYLPRRPNGFAFTLGYYGVKPGPFLFLPLIGPTTVRDMFGRMIDLAILPTAIGKPFNRPLYSVSTTAVRSLDERAQNDDQLTALREGTSDPYVALREAYLKNRQAEIDELRGIHRTEIGPVTALPKIRH